MKRERPDGGWWKVSYVEYLTPKNGHKGRYEAIPISGKARVLKEFMSGEEARAICHEKNRRIGWR